MFLRKIPRSAFLYGVFGLLLLSRPDVLEAATLPVGFSETQVTGGLNPVTMTFAPDGRLFVCEKQGLLRVVTGTEATPTVVTAPVLDLTAKVDHWNERGLLSLCFDPEFPINGWIYLYYTHHRDPADASSRTSSNNRVSRFTLKGNVADPASELVLLELTHLSKIGWHNGGGLGFGSDGKLYISTGENANGPYAQDGTNLLGKLLRLNRDGSIPTDNPHYHEFKDNNRAIAALGLRNPFTIAVQPGTGLLYLSMVGANYEQIESYDTATAPTVVNFGWPGIDGPLRQQTPPPGYRAPAYAYDHGRGDGLALCSGDFYNPAQPWVDAFPSDYAGKFFFSDYKGWIKWIDPLKPDTRHDFASGIDRPIDVDIAPDGALWYLARAGIPGGSDAANTASTNGSLWRVRWTGGGQPEKLAVIQQPVSAAAGASLGVVKIALQDASGNTVTAANDTITLSLKHNINSSAGGLSGTVKAAAVKGVATFTSLTLGTPGQGYTLSARSGSLAAVSSAAFDIGNQLAPPLITPPSGRFSGPVWVRLSNAVSGTTLRFTTDGTTPDATSTVYSTPFPITAANTIIQAIAEKDGFTGSSTASATLTISGNTPYGLDTRPPVRGVNLPPTPDGLPATLSATGLFSDTPSLTPQAGLLPYSLNSPAWSDHASTQHWMVLPEDSKIGFSPTGEYTWPGGTAFIQHFEMVMNAATGARRRLETRLLVVDAAGTSGYGATYRWRSDNTEADLVPPEGQEEVLRVTEASGSTREQTWNYPAAGLCFLCHTPTAGFVLGPKTSQLNASHPYPGGRTDNQLRTWNYLQLFAPAFQETDLPTWPHTVRIDDPAAPLGHRVRSYLDTNCAQCHRPGGTGALWDARFDIPLAAQNILNGDLRDTMGIPNAKIVAPGDPARSMMHLRMSSTTLGRQMPPLTRNVVDTTALEALAEWIRSQP